MHISSYTDGRNNNFNLIRVSAALAVLVTHSFALVTGNGSNEPLRLDLGITMGTIAVDVFFVTSGFLVSASLLNRQSAIEFILARFLRIYPALWMMLFLTAVMLGASMSTLSWSDYLNSWELRNYLVKCGTLLGGVEYQLPGVFKDNPFRGGINGSLWTLPYEIKMYGILLAIWVFCRILGKQRSIAFKCSIVANALFSGLYLLVGYFRNGFPGNIEVHDVYRFQSLFFMFFVGASYYILKDKINLSNKMFLALLICLLISSANRHSFFFIYTVSLPYLIFYLAYIPGGVLKIYNRFGDYSYGIYIYTLFLYSRQLLL